MSNTSFNSKILLFGEYGIMALESGNITSRQIEAARIAMTRKTKG